MVVNVDSQLQLARFEPLLYKLLAGRTGKSNLTSVLFGEVEVIAVPDPMS